ncbi:MAG: hypothetical protein Q4E62_04735, partial [Sutterellaceae bacterium]|nr:hypothetical protein [Sutterellaceae bacterium]
MWSGKEFAQKIKLKNLTLACVLAFSQAYAADTPILSESPTDPNVQEIIALNYCSYSLSRIRHYENRLVLDQQYDEIINNINLKKLKADGSAMLIGRLLDDLTFFKLQEMERERMNERSKLFWQNLILENIDPVLQTGVSALKFASTTKNFQMKAAVNNFMDTVTGACSSLSGIGRDVLEEISRDNKQFAMKKDELNKIHELNKDFFKT